MDHLTSGYTVSFVVTERCNLACEYCWYTRGIFSRHPPRELPLEAITQFLDQLIGYRTIDRIELTGGEALLHSEFNLLIPQLVQYTNRITLMTNGLRLDENAVALLKEYNVELHISLDSVITDYHQQYRGYQSETIETIRHLKNTGYTNAQIVCTLSRRNLEDIPQLIAFARHNQCEIDFHLLDHVEEHLALSGKYPDEIHTLFQYLDPWAANHRHRKLKLSLFRTLLRNPGFLVPSCLSSQHHLVIEANGDVYPCFNNKEQLLGNVLGQPDAGTVLNNHKRFKQKLLKPVSCFQSNCAHLIGG